MRRPPRPTFEVTNCDFKRATYSCVSWKRKSEGKRFSFLGLIEGLRRDAVERGEVFVQENPVAAQDHYPVLDLISGDDFVGHDEME